MKQIVEVYAAIWFIVLLMMIALAFTSINLNTAQARGLLSNLKAEVKASNGDLVPSDGMFVDSKDVGVTLDAMGIHYTYTITRQNLTNNNIGEADETYIYNSLYKINLYYEYWVPLFGKQVYPLSGIVY